MAGNREGKSFYEGYLIGLKNALTEAKLHNAPDGLLSVLKKMVEDAKAWSHQSQEESK